MTMGYTIGMYSIYFHQAKAIWRRHASIKELQDALRKRYGTDLGIVDPPGAVIDESTTDLCLNAGACKSATNTVPDCVEQPATHPEAVTRRADSVVANEQSMMLMSVPNEQQRCLSQVFRICKCFLLYLCG